jgi:suppressor of G2 allele of SKP1
MSAANQPPQPHDAQPAQLSIPSAGAPQPAPTAPPPPSKKTAKDWAALARQAEEEEEEEARAAGGDASLNVLFRDIFAKADDDTRRAMVKSYTESGGTCLSTSWGEVGKGKVAVTPPDGQEARKL